MAGRLRDGSTGLTSSRFDLDFLKEPAEGDFDWVDYRCQCPRCGATISDFRTKDLCNQLDTVDYRIAYHFCASCDCGAWIEFIRKPARDIDDFDAGVEFD